jgi:hypothetical protein
MGWQAWHHDYDVPDSPLRRRLATVQGHVRAALDAAPPGPLRVVSGCAGQGRDLLEVLADHPRCEDVTARLVELDPGIAALAERSAQSKGLRRVEVVVGDAGLTRHYRGMVPADLVLLCGVFGNVSDADVERTVAHCLWLCRTGGTLVWTRSRRAPDLVPQICRWFEERGFQRQWLSEPEERWGVGVHRFVGQPSPLPVDQRMFTFV